MLEVRRAAPAATALSALRRGAGEGVAGTASAVRAREDPALRLLADRSGEESLDWVRELRRRGSLVPARGGWVTVHDAVCRLVLDDRGTFARDRGPDRPGHVDSAAIQGASPAAHAALEAVLTARAVQGMRVDVEGWTDGLLDHMPGSVADLVDDLVSPLAGMVVGELLGAPSADWPQLQAWVADLVTPSRSVGRRETVRAGHAVRTYVQTLLLRRPFEPSPALVDRLLASDGDGHGLTRQEAGATALSLVLVGYEALHAVTGATLLALLRHPDQVELLLARPGSWPAAVDEAARWDPVVTAVSRRARSRASLAGVGIAAGERVVLSLAGANRDPDRYVDPDRFDVDRTDRAGHLGFGGGAHGCVGSGLGRLVAEVAAARLFARFPNARLVEAPSRVRRHGVLDVSSLPVRPGR